MGQQRLIRCCGTLVAADVQLRGGDPAAIAAWTLSAAAVISGVVYIWTTYAGTRPAALYLIDDRADPARGADAADPVSALDIAGWWRRASSSHWRAMSFLMLPGNT